MVKVAYTVGRFQPPTIGHKALIQAVKDAAGPGGKAYVFVSSTMSPKGKNPLTSKQKMPILKHMFSSGVTFVDTQECKDKGEPCGGAIAAFYWLMDKEGHKQEDITLVVGDDHKDDFGPDADIWKRKEEKDVFSPAGFKFLKSAKRDMKAPAADAANMSGTKARQYVKDDRKDDFYIAVGYDGAINKSAADAIYDVIKSHKGGKTKGRGGAIDNENVFDADDEPTSRRHRRTRRNRASNRALYRRDSRSHNGS